MSMEGELFPHEYDTHEQYDLAQEWADGYDMGYRQAEKDYLKEIRELELIIMDMEDLVQELLSKRN